MKIKVILNPVAGRGNARNIEGMIRDVLSEENCNFNIEETRAPNQAEDIARQAVKSGYDLIIAAGGDGTVNQVVNGMAGSGIPMGIIGCGTGNDFAAMIGMPKDIKENIKQILQGEVRLVDLCRVNQRYYISSVGVGFDGEVANCVNKGFRFAKGMTAYLLGVIKTLFSHKNRFIKLTVDGRLYQFKSLLVAVNNSATYGGGIKITPDARIDDGLLDVCAGKDLNFLEILYCLPLAVKGAHRNIKKLLMTRGREVILECETPLYYQMDGEVLQDKTLHFTVFPRSFPIKGARFEPSADYSQEGKERGLNIG